MGSEESSAPVKYDSLFAEIARDAVSGGQISTSMIQRNYEVGFNRAGRIMMQLERAGIVGPAGSQTARHPLPRLAFAGGEIAGTGIVLSLRLKTIPVPVVKN